jgi:Zn-dependent protease with chaperone function
MRSICAVWVQKITICNPWDMSISSFFNTYAGMYVTQSFCHAVIAALITDRALKAWKINDPRIRQRFWLIVVLFPIISFPLYQLVNPERGSALFRLAALFDSNRWLTFKIWDVVPIGILFLIPLVLSALIFLFQEMLPILGHTLEAHNVENDVTPYDAGPFLERASKTLGIRKPEVFLIDDDESILFSTTGRNPAIYLSGELTRTLDSGQFEAALAHEVAHIARSRRPMLIAIFIMRVIMFFNPIVLVKFRRIIKDEEKICDDVAVSLTGNPHSLAAALKTFYHKSDTPDGQQMNKHAPLQGSLEEYSHNLLLESRINRLEGGVPKDAGPWKLPFSLALAATGIVNYFIV